ncbi:hypothetical protein [Candidatus Uabimicrobium sp. HlEnr_7]|uniref:hypothetical protein n=1 Tax=Candidatus Uabimicrobium helgolandensis TaxID=3095367 RepID=UPI003558CA5E
MRYFVILLSLALANFVVCAEYDYEFEDKTDANGIYSSEGEFDGYNVKIRKIKLIDTDADNLLITNGKGVQYWNGPLKAGVMQSTQNTNTKTKYMTMKLTGKSNTSFKCLIVVEWRWGWLQKPMMMKMTIRSSGKVSSKDSKMLGTVRNTEEKISPLAEALIGGDDGTFRLNFKDNTDDSGYVSTKPQSINPKGLSPQIALLIVDHEFRNVELLVNDTVFHPEFSIKFNGRYIYKINLPVQSNTELKLNLTAEGGKPASVTNFILIYKDTK